MARSARASAALQFARGASGACSAAMWIEWRQYVVTHTNVGGAPFAGGELEWAQACLRDSSSPETTGLSHGLQFTVCA